MPVKKQPVKDCELAYVRLISSMTPTVTPTSVARLKQSIKRYEKTLQNKYRQLTQVQSGNKPNVDKFKHDFAMIKKHKQVTGIEVVSDKIYVFTKDIFLTVDDEIYKLGKFRIEFSRYGGEWEVWITNRNSTYRNRNIPCEAPHVAENGEPCFGNIGSTVYKLLGQGEFYAALILIIRYLESFNTNDDRALDYLYNFPVVKRAS